MDEAFEYDPDLDEDLDDEDETDVQWYPLPAWLQEAWDELHEEGEG